MSNATSRAFADDVISQFLYGAQRPSDLTDESLIRPENVVTQVSVNLTDFFSDTGPGRFARPAFFEFIQKFFGASGSTIADIVQRGLSTGGVTAVGTSSTGGTLYRIERAFLIAELGVSSARLAFNQSQFDDGKDDYARRVFIWSSQQFQISLNSDFIVSSDNGFSAEGRSIPNLSIIPDNRDFPVDPPRNGTTGLGNYDNFDFSGGGLAAILNPVVEPSIDPSGIGRTVRLVFDSGTAPPINYDFAAWQSDVENAPRSVGGFQYTTGGTDGRLGTSISNPDVSSAADGVAAAARLAALGPIFIQDLYSRGIIDYRQDDRDIFYGSLDDDVIQISLARDFQLYQAIAEGVAAGGIAVGGPGADSFTGSFLDDRFIIDRDDTFVNGSFGFDTVEYSTSNANNQSQESINFIVREDDQILIPGVPFIGDITGKKILRVAAATGENTTVFVGIERLAGTEFADILTVNSLAPLDNTDLVIDLKGNSLQPAGPDGIKTTDTLNLEGYSSSGVVISDLRAELQTVIDNEGGKGLRFKGVEAVRGSGGEDRIFASNSGDDIRGGLGKDEVTGGSGGDRIVGALETDVGSQFDDLAIDLLTGGGGADQFYAGDGDVITDPESGDEIYLRGQLLTGGEETEEGSRVYTSPDGGTYTLSSDGSLTFSINPTLTIQNFVNGRAGIRLIDAEPDTDEAEERRDPLIIDLDGDRNVLTRLADSTAYFDLDNDGFAERVAWAGAGDGFLVRDLDGSGTIDSGAEMFGTGSVDRNADRFQQFGEDGFAELALLDSNFDGTITAADDQYSELRVWIDANRDAVTDEGELVTLESLGIVSISLSTFASDHVDIVDDASTITRASTVGFGDGSTATIYDAYLSIDQYDAREVLGDFVIDETVADLPILLGTGALSDLDVAMTRDPGLAELVREFSELGIDQAHEILSRTQQILLRWTGADQVAPDTRGANMNAQWLHALEVITGGDFEQAAVGSNPRADAATILIGEWQELVSRMAAKLVGQTALTDTLTPGLSFKAAAFFTAEDGTDLASVLQTANDNRPAKNSEAIGYWAGMVAVLDQYRTALGVDETDFEAQIDAALANSGLAFTSAELRGVVPIAPGEDSVVGNGSGRTGLTDDIFLIQSDIGSVDGGSGNDVYVVSRGTTSAQITDASGGDELYLADHVRSEVVVAGIIDEGRTWLRVTDNNGELDIRIRLNVSENGIAPDVERIRFADGSLSDVLSLIEQGGSSFGVIFGAESPELVVGTADDDLIIGLGQDNAYVFGPGSGSDTLSDLTGENDSLIVEANFGDVEFAIDRSGTSDDLILTLSATGDTLRVIGHNSDASKSIESFVFNDTTLSIEDLDRILNTGTSGDDRIIGSRRDDVIEGLTGNDELIGGAGVDTYFFDAGWGEDRIIEQNNSNAVVFGTGIAASDIVAERGANGDLVLRAVSGDGLTIVGGLRSPLVTTFTFADGTVKTLLDYAAELSVDGDNLVSGTAANDRLEGTPDSELFVGNGGNDTFVGGGGVDRYEIGSGNTTIIGSSVGIDTILAPAGYDQFDLRFDDDFDVFAFGANGPVVDANSSIEFVLFENGFTVDLTGNGVATGTAGNDFLYSTGRAATVFRPGAGDDVIIGSTSESFNDIYEFEVGFGNDTIYDLGGRNDQIRFLSPELTIANATFEKVDSNLVISFASGDTLTVEGHYWNHPYDDGIPFFGQDTGNIEVFRFGNGQAFVGINGLVSSQTDGDDVVMRGSPVASVRDGGAGNDVLLGGREQNVYIWREGGGNDIVKDDGGNNQWVRFVGLEPQDVTVTRDPSDPFSIVFTIIATGETLTLDGTPDDGFRPDFDPRSDLRSRGLQIQEFIFDSVTLTDDDIIDLAFASDSSDGDDVIETMNSSRDINPGLGNDRIEIGNGTETVRIAPDSGDKVITFGGDGSRPGRGGSPFYVRFEGVARNELAFVELGLVDGVVGRHLRIIGGGSSVTIINGLDPRFNQFASEVGVELRFEVMADDGFAPPTNGGIIDGPFAIGIGTGRNAPLIDGTNGDDVLQGSGDPNEILDPGAGNDLIFGTRASERLLFDVGYGEDRYEWRGGDLTIEMGPGVAASDVQVAWSVEQPGLIEVSVSGTDDRVLLEPEALSQILVDGEVISFSTNVVLDPTTLPTSTVDPTEAITTQPGNELIVSTGGSATINVNPASGADFLQDARFESALEGAGDLDGWRPNGLVIDSQYFASQFRFLIEDAYPGDLIIEKPDGDRITILNQFGFGIPQVYEGYRSPDLDGDGAADWQGVDFDGDGTPDFDPLDANGDGAPDWLAADFDGDGQGDWLDVAFANAFIDSGDVFAEDLNLDGNFDIYTFYTDSIFYARDVDGDGIGDEYSEDYVTWMPLPDDRAGNVAWSQIDLDGNGEADVQGFADGTGPTWLSGWSPTTGDPQWEVWAYGELQDAEGNFIAEREFDLATGEATYFIYPNEPLPPPSGGPIIIGPGDRTVFLARDLDGDGVADVIGIDRDDDGQPDATIEGSVPVVVDSIILEDSSAPFPFFNTLSLADLIPRIEFVVSPTTTVIDLEALRPVGTDGTDALILGTGEEIDSLAGDDVVTSFGNGGVFRWSAGDGNDLFRSTLRVPEPNSGPGSITTTALDTIRFDGIIDPRQLRFFASDTNPADLVIEIEETGERLTIAGQLGATAEGAEAAPPVGRFVFESGLELTAGDVASLLREPAGVSDEDVQITDTTGGLLDGGAGGDGDDMLLGGTGDDIYRFGRDYAEDTIIDAGGTDTVQFGEGIKPDDLFFSRTGESGEDLLIEVLGIDRLTLTIEGQFAKDANRIERFAFEDGTRIDWLGVQQIILDRAETSADDTIVGFDSDDVIRGGKGNDVLTAAGGDDELFGGEGRDAAVFTGASAEYLVSVVDGVTTVTDTVAERDGTNTLDSIEDLVFLGDGTETALQPANNAPVAGDIQFTMDEDGTLTIDRSALISASSDADGDAIALGGISDVLNGQAWVSADGNIRFRPLRDFVGQGGFAFSVNDGNGGSATARVLVAVGAVNDAPIITIAGQEFTALEDTAIAWTLPSSAVTDPDGDPLTLEARLASGDPLPAWLEFDGASFTGTPPDNFNGTLEIELTADDGTVATSAPLRINIEAINDAPELVGTLDDLTLRAGETFTFAFSQSAFVDPEGDSINYTFVAGDGGSLPAWITVNGVEISGTVPADFAEPLELAVIADDGRAASVAAFSIVPFVNTAPEVVVQLEAVSSDEDTPVNYTIPDGSFADVDGDVLTLSATLADGSDLPAWLSFDGSALTGTPPADFNGSLAIRISASDGLESVSDTLDLTIAAVNDAPVVITPVSDVSSNEDAPFAFTVDPATFADVDGDTLMLSATLPDGSALPDWITFDGASFTGTPPQDFNGSIDLTVTASDGELSVASGFTLTIDPLNDPPVLIEPLADLASPEDTAFSFEVPEGTFADIDGDALTLSATLADGSDLPDWFSFDGAAFSGTPPQDFNGFIDVRVSASDGVLSVADDFRLTISPVNDAPVLSKPLLDQAALGDTVVQFSIPSGSFTDVDGDLLELSATLADGSALPSWLAFDSTTLTFEGVAPNLGDAFDIRVTAWDGELSVSDDFTLTIDAQNTGGGSTEGFSFASVNSWYNPAWGGGYNVTFNYDVQPDAIAEGELKAWDIVASYTGLGTITGGWVNGFPGPATFEITSEGAVFSTDGQDYQPELAEGQTFQITVQVDGAPYTAGDFAFEIFDRDPALNLADDQDTSLTIAPTNDWGSGLGQSVSFTNSSDTTIDDWQIVLNVPDGVDFAITNVWDATATVLANGNILFEAVSSNEEIAPGAQASFGFNASYSGVGGLTFSQFDFSFTDSDARQFDVVLDSLGTAGANANWTYGTIENDDLTGQSGTANRMFGGVGNDTLTGGTLGDWLAGGSGDDSLFGLNGDDTLWGGHGNDLLYGGLGFDTVQLLGERDSYSVVTQGGAFGVRINDLSAIAHGDDGMDQLSSIEQLAFRGGDTLNIASPIILDLAGDGIQTVSAADSEARFDLDGDGLADDTSWIGSNDAFLYLDRDGNGTMSGVEEISFIDDAPNAATDLAGLHAFDSNGDGVLSSGDERFAEFGVWRDGDGDGAVDAGETASLATVGIRLIDLTGTPVDGVVNFGEVAVANTGTFTLANGVTREFADAALTYFSATTNMPELTATHYDFGRKSKKYRLSVEGGAVSAVPKKSKRGMDPHAGQLGANTILTFSNETYGMFAPVVLDLDGDGIELVKRTKSAAMFDYNGDGADDDTGWLKGDDGFLVIDRNNDGLITEASELTLASEDEDARSGLQGLARLDSNGDGRVDTDDARFGELRVWQDRNGNGRTEAGELRTLEEAGIVSIRLDAVTANQDRVKLGKNALVATTSFVRSNGTTSTAADISLAYRPGTAPAASSAFDIGTGIFGFSPDLFLPRGEFGPALRDEISLEDVFDRLRDSNFDAVTDLFNRFDAQNSQDRGRLNRTLTVPVVEEAPPERPRSWFDPASAYFTMFWPSEIAPVFDQAFQDSSFDLRLKAAFEGMSDTSSETEKPNGQHMRVMPDERVLLDEVVEAGAQSEEAGADSNGQSAPSNPSRLAIEDQEDWGGRLRVDFAQLTDSGATPEPLDILVGMRQEAVNDTDLGENSASIPASADAELARKLMMIRQDMSTFGAKGAGEEERLHYENQDYLQFYA